MLAVAARSLGYRVVVLDPEEEAPAAAVCDRHFTAAYDDAAALDAFAREADIITYEFENIPAASLQKMQEHAPVFPDPSVLHVCQNRRREKEFLQCHGFPIAPFRIVESADALTEALSFLGTPCVLKTADFGYDGKGQRKLEAGADCAAVWREFGAAHGVVEAWIDFSAELSVIVARGREGELCAFPPALNVHERHILTTSEAPAPLPEKICRDAQELAGELARQLGVVGLLAVELFLRPDGTLLVNELAPRPHNSGHYTLDACPTSQFEQSVRAVCGLPLGEAGPARPALMRNLLGDLWAAGTPHWPDLLALPGLHLHLYGKRVPRPGRKMGHYTVIADTLDAARAIDTQARALLQRVAANA